VGRELHPRLLARDPAVQELRAQLGLHLLTRALLFFAAALFVSAAHAQTAQPRLWTHESYIEDITRTDTLDITNPLKVFAFVFGSLPDQVKVYPTENYYYFQFLHNGTPFAGNIRLERSEDDKVSLHFAYYEKSAEWRPETPDKHVVFGAEQGVLLEKIERFVYRVSYDGKSVVFRLNDLSQVKPPAGALAPDEKFIGPIFDDSGIQFFLVYNTKLKIFLYVLNETVKATEELFPYEGTDRILVGKRTGFAYYRDHKLDRKILIGVLDRNVILNTYFDGPFDQLPDAFVEGEALRAAILEQRPDLKGRIDRFGKLRDGDIRYSIAPYLMYFELKELGSFHKCASSHIHKPTYYNCFVAAKVGFDPAEQDFDFSTKPGAGKPKRRH
jgi:hypothetical protein